MYSLISYSHVISLFIILILGELNMQIVYSYIFCHCDTDECRAFGYKECKAEFYCYSIYELNSITNQHIPLINHTTEITGISISRGCISNSFITMCTKKEIQYNKQFKSPYLITRCCRDAWCNTDKVKIAQSNWSLHETKRYTPGDYSNYDAKQTQFKTGTEASSLLTNSKDFQNLQSDLHLTDKDFSENLLNSKLLHQDVSKQTIMEDRSDMINSRRGIRRKGDKGDGNIETDSSRILTKNFQLSYFNPVKSAHSKSYSMNMLLARPIYVAMGISLAILLFGLIFLSFAMLIYRKNKLLHTSNCRTVCTYSRHNRNSITSPISERVICKNATGISENTDRLHNWNQPIAVFPNQHSTDEPLLLNGISSVESMNPSTDYRSLTLIKTRSKWLKSTGYSTSPEKEENAYKENLFTYYCNHCICCYSNNDNNVTHDTNDFNHSTNKNFKSFINLSQFNKRTITNDINNDHLHPVICETSEFSLNTDNQKHEPSSISTPLFSIHSSSTQQLPDFIEYKKLNTTNYGHSNNNGLLINDQDTFKWIKNQQSTNQNTIKFQQLQKNIKRPIHSMLNDFNGTYSDSSYLYDIDHKNNNSDYEHIKTMPKQKFIEMETRKSHTIQVNNNIDSVSPVVCNDKRRNTDCSSSNSSGGGGHLENGSINQQSVLPVQFTDLVFPHLPPPPSYPPPPLYQQQEPQQKIIEIFNPHNSTNANNNNTINNNDDKMFNHKNTLFVDLHRFDILLQRQRGTGKTSSGGEDNKTIESEQSDIIQTWKISGSNENSNELNTVTLDHRMIPLNNNNNNNQFLKCSPDLNKLTGHRMIETDLIGLATFRKADEKYVDLVTPYAQFDLSPDSSLCITAE
ncbi:unnamed protein product [Schistosoma rodhaini]|nr:unnamed protein product [Schistosoma rodhaini]